jgi:hypothetical protein
LERIMVVPIATLMVMALLLAVEINWLVRC